jgi:hypothetical protein
MKPRQILCVTIAVLLAGCGEEKRNAELEKLRAEKAALEEQVAAQHRAVAEEKLRVTQEAAERTAQENAKEAERLSAERKAVEIERKRMLEENERATSTERAAMAAELRKREDALRAAEIKAAAELKEAADAKARAMADEKRMAAEKAERDAELRRKELALRASAKRTVDFFYSALDPHGDWDEIEGYGHVFQPREAQRDRNWRPYTDGEWIWTDRGWAWRSNEPHGWATAHYGRWVRHAREGWMWVPGSEWAPAWVSWRRNDDYIGWAPLPPEAHSGRGFNASVDEYYDIGARNYTFVPRERFCGNRSYVGLLIPVERNSTILRTTVNVTNISYQQTGAGAVLTNHGPDISFVNARATRPLEQVRLERDDVSDARNIPGPATVAGGLLRMIAPVIAHERPASAPRVIRKTATREIDRGWTGEDAASEKTLRDKAAAEARTAEETEREIFKKATPPAKPPVLQKVTPPTAPAIPPKPAEGGLRSEKAKRRTAHQKRNPPSQPSPSRSRYRREPKSN